MRGRFRVVGIFSHGKSAFMHAVLMFCCAGKTREFRSAMFTMQCVRFSLKLMIRILSIVLVFDWGGPSRCVSLILRRHVPAILT